MVERDNNECIVRLKECYAENFKPKLGTVKGVTAKLHLQDKPVFQKAQQVPYALRPKVEKELKKMKDKGIIEPVEVSIWATPMSLYLRQMARFVYSATTRGLSTPPFKRSSFLF